MVHPCVFAVEPEALSGCIRRCVREELGMPMTETNFHMSHPRQMPSGTVQRFAQPGLLRYVARPSPTEVCDVLRPEANVVASMHGEPGGRFYRDIGKRAFDISFVLFTAPFAIMLVAISAILLWIEGGSPFYRQKRLGESGSVFYILKMRTMIRNADEMLERHLAEDETLRREWDATQKLKNDPRITRVGSFLRKTSLDELPQLWNVLRGEMSIVGARPMMVDQLALYGNANHYFALKPGITGFWQVSERNESLFKLRVTLDAEYDRCLSLVQDLRVLYLTVGAVLKRTGY